jgi:succinate dehydrogenase/fumarate reductase-like Fe-S protein
MKPFKWIYAKCNLAWALVLHVLYKRWFTKHGLEHFLENYKADGIFPISKEVRAHYYTQDRCIGCGLCVIASEVSDPVFYQRFLTPAALSFSYARSLPDVEANHDFLAYCTDSRACGKVCPTGMPPHQNVEFVSAAWRPGSPGQAGG